MVGVCFFADSIGKGAFIFNGIEERFGDDAGVFGAGHLFFQSSAHFGDASLMGWVLGEVVNFPRVVFGIVKFFVRLVAFPKFGVVFAECSLLPCTMPSLPGRLRHLVEGEGRSPEVRSEVADVFVAAVGETTTESGEFVKAIGEKVGVVLSRGIGSVFAEDGSTLHVWIWRAAGEGEKGGGKVDEADDFVGFFIKGGRGEVGPFFGDVDDHGDADAGVVEISFSTRSGAAVVTVVEDDGVFGEAVTFELGEDLADSGVGGGDDIVVSGDVTATFRKVGEM